MTCSTCSATGLAAAGSAAGGSAGAGAAGVAAVFFAAVFFAVFLADFFAPSASGAGIASRTRRTTGASIVDDAERTNSPIS